MSKPTLKEVIISKIQNIDNDAILREVYRLLEIEQEDLESYTLTDDQVSVVNEAKEQINIGQFLTHEEAQIKINKWLNNNLVRQSNR